MSGSDRSDSPPQDVRVPDIDRAIELYRSFGHTPERIASQLVRSGYPLEAITERFPTIPVETLPVRSARASREQRVLQRTAEAGLKLSGERARRESLPTQHVGSAMQNVLEKVTATRIGASAVRAASPPTGTAEGSTSPASDTALTATDVGRVSFQYVPLIQCSFPHADPGTAPTYSRRNGWLELTLFTGRPEIGLPYGVPARLLTIFCTSEAVRTRSPEINLGSSVHEFLRRLDVPITRGERGSLRIYANQLLRLAHCAITIDEHLRDANGRVGLHIKPGRFIEDARLWWDDKAGIGKDSQLILSAPLFESILERSAPLSTAAIRQLRKSPMDLDVYAWLVHRLFNLSKPSMLSWEQLSGQIGHSYGEIRYFRRFFGDSLKRVLRVYPEARLKVTETGLTLLPSKPHIERRTATRA